jgi:hypothetical protein
MKLCNMLYLIVFSIIVTGCKAPQNAAPFPRGENSTYSRVFSIDAPELSDIIPPLCEDLGITIEDTTETPSHYKATCKSITGRDIGFEAVAIVKGRTLVGITVQGRDDIAKTICREIGNRLRPTIESYIKE